MYFSYGWPRSLVTGATAADSEAIYAAQGTGEYIVVVFNATIQIWSGGEHRLKLGELHRTAEAVEEEGLNVRAHWCPQKRVLAVATAANHLQLYSLNVSSEAVWRLPNGRDVRRVNVYLSHSIHLDYGTVRIADLGGDARSLLVALSNGTMQVFSWQGKLRGQANPFIAAYEGSRSRAQRSRSQALTEGSRLGPRGSLASSSSQGDLPSAQELAAALRARGSTSNLTGTLGTATGPVPAVPAAAAPAAAGEGGAGAASALLAAMAAMDLPQPTPTLPAEVAVARIHYAPAARMLAVVLADGRCALCRTADSGIHPVEQLQLFRWVHKPAGPAAPAVVAAALNPTAQLLALGMSHGRVAIYTMQSLLAHGRQLSHPSGTHPQHQRGGSGQFGSFGSSGALGSGGGGGGGGAGQPEPVRVLSLADWGFRSSVVGAATQLQWSPDGRVLAVGYAQRGMAVWTPSGCRLMCSLRQAVATAMPGGNVLGLAGGPAAQLAAGTPTHRSAGTSPGAAEGGSGAAGSSADAPSGQQGQPQRSSTDSAGGALGSPGRKVTAGPAGSSGLDQGVLEGGVTALAWSAHGYQLLVAEAGKGSCLHQLEFARQVHGGHRAAAAAAPGSGQEEVQALQAADRILLITEARQSGNPALRLPASPRAAGGGGQNEFDAAAAAARPDLTLQHIKLPQQYIEAAYPLMHAAISQDRQDIAVAGSRGLAVYSRRARRWRLFGDATQERSIQVHGLMWLPGGVIAAVAHVEGGGRGQEAASPQLLLYPQYHLDSASLLARMPLPQVPVAMDSAGWHMVLAFAPLDLKLYKVAIEGQLGPGAAKQSARLSLVRELSIMGLGNPLQEIALIDPLTLPRDSEASSTAAASAASSRAQTPHDAAPQQAQQGDGGLARAGGSGGSGSSLGPGFPQLPPVATRPRTPTATETLGAHAASDTPQQCVLLRAGGIMSKLDMQEGTEVLLSDAIERFWLPISPAAAGVGAPTVGGGSASVSVSRTGSFLVGPAGGSSAAEGSGPGSGGGGGPPLSTSSSMAGLARNTSDAELSGAVAAAAAAQLAAAGGRGEGGQPGQPPRVEMPWWTYGARGMQLWFPSSLSEPLTPSLRSLASPTATGLAAAAAAAASNSTDPELEFDREVYPIGVSLTEVSIIGVMQRVVRSPVFPPEAAQSLCFHPLPESQPVLPCLLRRLLQKGRYEDALELARWHSSGPHFNRSLEWLLFTALEIDADTRPHGTTAGAAGAAAQQAAPILGSPIGAGPTARQARFNSSYSVTVGGGAAPASKRASEQRQAGPLLLAAARLISQFPQFPEIVVSVARKTDAALWPALFAAVGSPLRLCQGLMRADQLQSAACCLVIVERIEGGALAQQAALQLMQAALGVGQYGLAADLLRFLVPPGEGEALLTPSSAAAAADSGAVAESGAAESMRQRQGQQAVEAAAQPQPAQEAAAAEVEPGVQQQPGQPTAEQAQAGGGSWFWGLLGMGGSSSTAESSQPAAAAAAQQQAAAAQAQQQQQQEQQWRQQQEEEEAAAAGDAWRLTAQHAWKLLDSGALREAAQLARALAELHGGLPALLAATAAEVPGAAAHLSPSAAAIASALFVAANEFLVAEGEGDAALAAESLMQACQDAGCVNLATALALLLGDEPSLQRFATENPAVWADLHRLIANDVHLCGFAPVLSPLPSPVVASVAAGGSSVGAGQA